MGSPRIRQWIARAPPSAATTTTRTRRRPAPSHASTAAAAPTLTTATTAAAPVAAAATAVAASSCHPTPPAPPHPAAFLRGGGGRGARHDHLLPHPVSAVQGLRLPAQLHRQGAGRHQRGRHHPPALPWRRGPRHRDVRRRAPRGGWAAALVLAGAGGAPHGAPADPGDGTRRRR